MLLCALGLSLTPGTSRQFFRVCVCDYVLGEECNFNLVTVVPVK